jgi:type VI secretion system protein ImpJ
MNGTEGRYALRDFEAYDTHSASPQPAPLLIGRLRLRYMLEMEDRAGYLCIGLARVTEVAADRRASLDDRWIPPALLCSAALPLSGLISEFSGMLNQRGEALAARMTAPGASRGVAEFGDFLLLQSVNRWQKLLAHWADAGNIHPEDLYSAFVQMAGELATFTEPTRRPNSYPAYRHDDLQRSFAPVVADLRRSLSAVLEQNAVIMCASA